MAPERSITLNEEISTWFSGCLYLLIIKPCVPVHAFRALVFLAQEERASSNESRTWRARCMNCQYTCLGSRPDSKLIPFLCRISRAYGSEATSYSFPQQTRRCASQPVLASNTDLQVVCQHHWYDLILLVSVTGALTSSLMRARAGCLSVFTHKGHYSRFSATLLAQAL